MTLKLQTHAWLPHRIFPLLLPLLLIALASSSAAAEELEITPTQTTAPASTTPDGMVIKIISDPIEGANRSFFAFNDQVMDWFLMPLNKGYRFILPQPVRKSIRKAGDNLAFPMRFFCTMLQGKFMGTAHETGRFVVNSTVGVAGLFDPATRIGLKKYDEDFGQTFGSWGMGHGFYLMLPFLGPSSGRELAALPFNSVTNPASFLPGAGFFLTFNKMSFQLDLYERLMEMEQDPYAITRDAWALDREKDTRDINLANYPSDPLPTLEALFVSTRDPKFYRRNHESSVRIESTGLKLPFNYWLQKKPAPLVFVVPGVGNHRLSESALAMAEMVWNDGFSVVTISNPLNWEFTERAGSVDLPGYTPADAQDLYQAIKAAHDRLQKKYPGRIQKTAVMGFSLSGLHALYISAMEQRGELAGYAPDRYIAVHPPLDVSHALNMLDEYYQAPQAWPEAEREDRIRITLLKALACLRGELRPGMPIPFDQDESRFLIGINYRLFLQSIIINSQQHHNMGILTEDADSFVKDDLYQEVRRFSYNDYYRLFVLPYFVRVWRASDPRYNALTDEAIGKELMRTAGFWSFEREAAVNDKNRVFVNDNDFLLQPNDLERLQITFGQRMTVFSGGGHMGNLHQEGVQRRIMDALQDLKR